MCDEATEAAKKQPRFFRLRYRDGFGSWRNETDRDHVGIYFPATGVVTHMWEDNSEMWSVTSPLKGEEALEALRNHYKIEWVK